MAAPTTLPPLTGAPGFVGEEGRVPWVTEEEGAATTATPARRTSDGGEDELLAQQEKKRRKGVDADGDLDEEKQRGRDEA